jgi:hypothetical protein
VVVVVNQSHPFYHKGSFKYHNTLTLSPDAFHLASFIPLKGLLFNTMAVQMSPTWWVGILVISEETAVDIRPIQPEAHFLGDNCHVTHGARCVPGSGTWDFVKHPLSSPHLFGK